MPRYEVPGHDTAYRDGIPTSKLVSDPASYLLERRTVFSPNFHQLRCREPDAVLSTTSVRSQLPGYRRDERGSVRDVDHATRVLPATVGMYRMTGLSVPPV